MDKKLVVKMIRNCFKQYYSEAGSLPMDDKELEELADRILIAKKEDPSVDLYEVVNDMVYEFLTD